MKIVKYLIATALCFVSMSYGQRQTGDHYRVDAIGFDLNPETN